MSETICTTCLRLKQGLCDGEKELTACPSYKLMTNGDRIRAMTDEELALLAHNLEAQSNAIGQADIDGKALSVEEWLDWLKQEASEC